MAGVVERQDEPRSFQRRPRRCLIACALSSIERAGELFLVTTVGESQERLRNALTDRFGAVSALLRDCPDCDFLFQRELCWKPPKPGAGSVERIKL